MATPPENILRVLDGCNNSQCAKSKRAVVVFDPLTKHTVGKGWNTPPAPFACTGSDECKRDCSKLCVHAEQMAITDAISVSAARSGRHGGYLTGLELVHGKFVDGKLVPGGPPSCWQCSKLILEVDLKGVWLFEVTGQNYNLDATGRWKFYNALEFHHATLKACELYDYLA